MEKGVKNLAALNRNVKRRGGGGGGITDDDDSGLGQEEDVEAAAGYARVRGQEAAAAQTMHVDAEDLSDCQQCREERRRSRCSDVEQGAHLLLDLPRPISAKLPSLRSMALPEIR